MRVLPRAKYAALVVSLIGLGLLIRFSLPGLAPVVAKYAGSVVWGAMVYCLVACVRPTGPLLQTAVCAAAIAIGVEVSQLWHLEILDAFRRTSIGVLLIGRFFAWWDIASYLIGIAVLGAIDRVALRPDVCSPQQ